MAPEARTVTTRRGNMNYPSPPLRPLNRVVNFDQFCLRTRCRPDQVPSMARQAVDNRMHAQDRRCRQPGKHQARVH